MDIEGILWTLEGSQGNLPPPQEGFLDYILAVLRRHILPRTQALLERAEGLAEVRGAGGGTGEGGGRARRWSLVPLLHYKLGLYDSPRPRNQHDYQAGWLLHLSPTVCQAGLGAVACACGCAQISTQLPLTLASPEPPHLSLTLCLAPAPPSLV